MDIPQTNGAAPHDSDLATNDAVHGRAALLIVESLMHLLVTKGVISREDFVEVIEDAAEVESMSENVQSSLPSDHIGSLLFPLSAAFRRELGR